ncbi:hypothetical protein M0R45_017069 [Rubus argutus]|uniref:Uncharacterized protein n=1 Tax=Rubus argutus TaxID=59490 RepID=A0AAW1XUA4_RUBAR
MLSLPFSSRALPWCPIPAVVSVFNSYPSTLGTRTAQFSATPNQLRSATCNSNSLSSSSKLLYTPAAPALPRHHAPRAQLSLHHGAQPSLILFIVETGDRAGWIERTKFSL